MNPPDILYVLGWVGSYHEAMASHLGISTETLEPTLIPPERERYLISKYVQLSAQKVTEWAGNVLQRLRTSFAERKSIPDTDAEDRYVTPAGIDLFQIMKQHVETATQANNSKLLFGVVETVTTVVKKFQDGVELMISEEREIVEQSREKLDWYEEHVIMIGNTALKWVSYSSDLADFVQDSFSPEHAGPGSRYLRSLADGWVSVAKSVIAVLLSLISSSIRPAILQLFTPIWYAGTEPLMGTIVATLEDYFGDYSHHADPFLITKLASDLSDHLIILYIDQMRAKGSRLRMPAAAGLFVSDQDALASWMLSVRDPERTRRTIEPLQRWCALISAPHRMLVIDFFAFFKASSCDPSVIPLLEDVLPKRDDLDKHAVKEIVEACKKRAKEEISHSINQSKSAPSLFTRLLRTK